MKKLFNLLGAEQLSHRSGRWISHAVPAPAMSPRHLYPRLMLGRSCPHPRLFHSRQNHSTLPPNHCRLLCFSTTTTVRHSAPQTGDTSTSHSIINVNLFRSF